jgi:DNA-binding beta-propeller fold protein YncE
MERVSYTVVIGNWRLIALLVASTILAAAILTSVQPSAHADEHEANWEVWALDQGEGLNRIHVFDQNLEETARIDFGELDAPHNTVQTPHMIDFDATNQFAVVASTASGTVSIIRTADYEVLDTIETGATAHMASFTPDNSAIWVANIGAQTLTRIDVDIDNERFEVAGEIPITSALHDEGWDGWQEALGDDLADWPGPVCHEYTADSQYAYVTMGPAAGGLVVVDIQAGVIETAFDPREIRANCGLALDNASGHMFANWSGPIGAADDPSDAEPGEWYVFDTASHELVSARAADDGTDTLGQDPHGVRISPDGTEYWQVNRISNDGIVIDAESLEIIDDFVLADTPDILDFSPDGQYAFVTLRGPNPASMPHVAVGHTPGIEVFDVATPEHAESSWRVPGS